MITNYDNENLESINKKLEKDSKYLEKSYRMIENDSVKQGNNTDKVVITPESAKKCAQLLINNKMKKRR